MKTDRREFIRVVSLGTASLFVGSAAAQTLGQIDTPGNTPQSPNFPLGTTSGDVDAGAAILSARYTGNAPLRLLVWRMENNSYVRVADLPIAPASGGFVQAEASGLTPGETYRFAFHEGALEQRSSVGQFKAPPADDASPSIVLGVSSCTRYFFPMGALEQAGKRQDLQAFILLGDTVYCDGANTLDDYRWHWARTMGTKAYRSLRANVNLIATWDDHECENNFHLENTPPAQLAAAKQAFRESLCVRRFPNAPDRIWRSIRFGRTAEVFVLDSRSERRPSQKEYIGRAQMDWLKAGLLQSQATFKIIAHSVPITDFPFNTEWEDTWRGFPAQRTEILSHIDDNAIPGVVWVAGDHHFGCLGRVAASGLGSTQLEILAGPGANWPNSDYQKCTGPQFDYVTGSNNYVALHLNPVARSLRAVFHGTSGNAFAERTFTL